MIANDAGFPVEPSIVQCTGVAALPPGNASVNVTPVAFPRPGFDTVTVKPIAVPAETEAASAALVTSICGQFTVSDADAESEPSFEVVTEAVLSYFVQLVLDVAAVTCTVRLALAAMLIG